jgi:hypothetical protein
MALSAHIAAALVLLSTASAAAQAPLECDAATVSWARNASRQTDLHLEPVRCARTIIVLRLTTAPLVAEVEIRRSASGGFRRAGPYAVSPILEVSDYRELPAPFREAFETLVRYVSDDAQSLDALSMPTYVVNPVPRAPPVRAVLAIVLIVLGFRYGRARPETFTRRDTRLFVICGLAALAARLFLSPWETFRGGQGPLWIAALHGYTKIVDRPGYAELYGFIAHGAGTEVETAVFAMNAVLSTIAAVLVALVVRRLGASPVSTFAAAAFIALDPVSIRMAATESHFVPIAFTAAAGALLGLFASERLDHGRRWHALSLMVGAALLVDQTARIHPAAWAALVPIPLVMLATPRPLRTRITRLVLYAAILLGLVAPSFPTLARMIPEALEATNDMIPTGGLQLFGALLIAFVATPRERRRVLLYAAPAVALIAWSAMAYDPLPDVRSGFLRTGALAAILVVVFVVLERLRTSPARVPVAVAIILFNTAWSWSAATELDTSALENRVVRRILGDMPADCEFVHAGDEPMLPLYHGRRVGEGARGRSLGSERGALAASGTRDCTYYYRGSFCSTETGVEVCPRVEEGARLRELETHELDAKAHTAVFPFHVSTVTVALFEVAR